MPKFVFSNSNKPINATPQRTNIPAAGWKVASPATSVRVFRPWSLAFCSNVYQTTHTAFPLAIIVVLGEVTPRGRDLCRGLINLRPYPKKTHKTCRPRWAKKLANKIYPQRLTRQQKWQLMIVQGLLPDEKYWAADFLMIQAWSNCGIYPTWKPKHSVTFLIAARRKHFHR